MKLYATSPSPFVRKVLVMAIETGLSGRIEHVSLKTTPVAPDSELIRSNPIAKMPTLITDTGAALYDSRVICEYLDSLHNGIRMFPVETTVRWTALRRQALGDGVLDAAVSIRYETVLRPEEKRWREWIEGQMGKVRRGLDTLENEVTTFDDDVNIGIVTAACVAGYLDFRFPEEDWRATRPGLRNWYAEFSARDSMVKTQPVAVVEA